MSGYNKEIYDFFKELNIVNVKKLIVEPDCRISLHYTHFHFEVEDGTKLVFFYARNKQIQSIRIMKENDILFLKDNKSYRRWMNSIWEQFVDRFNLYVKLMFINENVPWRWDVEYLK